MDEVDPVMVELEQDEALREWLAEVKKFATTTEGEARLMVAYRRMVRACSDPAVRKALSDKLTKLFEESIRIPRRDTLEMRALDSLNRMASQPGMACAVVFTGPGHLSDKPRKVRGDAGPEPEASAFDLSPTSGNVVAQGFARTVSDEDKAFVEARFPGYTATWLLSGG